jgi:MFS transporter, PAT family, solute carrier family 33 (acetyl-CoA transportor), member 1
MLYVSIGVVVPLVIGRYTNGPRPMSIFLVGVPLRILSGIFLALVLNRTKSVFAEQSDPGNKFWTMFLVASAFNNIAVNLMFVAQVTMYIYVYMLI